MHKRITNREFKLLIEPKGLDRRSRIAELSDILAKFCKRSKVPFSHLDNAHTGLRNIIFYDTPDHHFRQNNLILRVRAPRRDVWIDDWCEVTFKCRAGAEKEAKKFDPTPRTAHPHRLRFKEEILRGEKLGTARTIYSNNAILDVVPLDDAFDQTFHGVSQLFPCTQRLEEAKNSPIEIVGGQTNTILEACLPLGNLSFGEGVHAHFELAIWMRNVGEPIIGELAFAYRVNKNNRDNDAAHRRADSFYSALQLAIPSWLANGSTKTALFLIIGAVSFGGGIVAYERALFVENKKWLSEDEFMADLALSQTTPGLIAINLAVLAGDRLAGVPGALASVLGLILPGTAFVMMAGFLYEVTKAFPIIGLALSGIAAGAVDQRQA
eukprot:gene5959-6030_t